MNCSCSDLQASCGLVRSNEKPIINTYNTIFGLALWLQFSPLSPLSIFLPLYTSISELLVASFHGGDSGRKNEIVELVVGDTLLASTIQHQDKQVLSYDGTTVFASPLLYRLVLANA